jgi:hypothetical protein
MRSNFSRHPKNSAQNQESPQGRFRQSDLSRATVTETSSPKIISSAAGVTGWAIYLAMAWTWCIGMFLPVLLMRELGIAGVITFAVPNILGAAAMGWVIRSADQSRRMVENNRAACVWFSLITIVYHAFFAAWLIRRLAGPNTGAYVVVLFVAFWLILHWRRGGGFFSVTSALVVTLTVMAWGFWRGDLPYIAHPVEGTRLAPINNLWLAPAWILGFACCPYLDLTFHAARQALSPMQSRIAFTLGFCVLFTFVLILTVCYSGWLVIGFDRAKYPQLALILSAHLIVQSCLTCALHLRQVSRVEKKLPLRQFAGFSVLLVGAVALGLWENGNMRFNGITQGEIIYRVFLGFYGLVVPAYVWLRLCKPRRSLLRIWTVILIAAPLYALGFAGERMPFIVPGVLIIVLSKFIAEPQATTA